MLAKPGATNATAPPTITTPGRTAMFAARPRFFMATPPSVTCRSSDRTLTASQNSAKNDSSCGPLPKVAAACALRR